MFRGSQWSLSFIHGLSMSIPFILLERMAIWFLHVILIETDLFQTCSACIKFAEFVYFLSHWPYDEVFLFLKLNSGDSPAIHVILPSSVICKRTDHMSILFCTLKHVSKTIMPTSMCFPLTAGPSSLVQGLPFVDVDALEWLYCELWQGESGENGWWIFC